jgi:hypothetical protein
LILGITIVDVEYLERTIRTGVLTTPISAVRNNPPYGVNCVVELSVRGIGTKSGRTVDVRTVWEIEGLGAFPVS